MGPFFWTVRREVSNWQSYDTLEQPPSLLSAGARRISISQTAPLDKKYLSYIFLVYVTIDFEKITGFDWDDGNVAKNEVHGVSYLECEEVFFGDPLYITPDESHSGAEQRFRVLGQTRNGRLLAVIITLRKQNTLIRVISARDMHRKERKLYEEGT